MRRLLGWIIGLACALTAIPAAAESLQARIDAAQPGETILVTGGQHAGPLVINQPIRLIGEGLPVIDGGGEGTVVWVRAPNVEVSGFKITGSGGIQSKEDAGILVTGAGALIRENILEDVLFGIIVKGADGSVIQGNQVTGRETDLSRAGDGLRVWFSQGAQVLDNTLERTREMIIESSHDVVLRGNVVRNGRQGLHLMRTDNILVEQNSFEGNSVGFYAMYARSMIFRQNQVIGNRGPSGYGIGLKDGEGNLLEQNLVVQNNVGLYVDNSPTNPTQPNLIRSNLFLNNDVGLLLTPVTNGNRFTRNDFIDNLEQVSIRGGGRLGQNDWSFGGTGNYWSDYTGYDASGDGIGDYPHRAESLFESLMSRQPHFRWFIFSPAATAVDLAAKAFPMVAPEPKLEDRAPLIRPTFDLEPIGTAAAGSRRMLVTGLLMLGAGAAVVGLGLGRGLGRKRGGLTRDSDNGADQALRAIQGG